MDSRILDLNQIPTWTANFEKLRSQGCIYVDKTALLLELVSNRFYAYSFLSRPRRMGKSLMISTLEAMFKGQAKLFKGLVAEKWVKIQAKNPPSVLRFDLSTMTRSPEMLETLLVNSVFGYAKDNNLTLDSTILEGALAELLKKLHEKTGQQVVVLIDEYDAPVVRNLHSFEIAEAMRVVLSSFYSVLKSSDEHLQFVMLTGISKFSKLSVFSAINNLRDLSMDSKFGTIVGFTQEELNLYFGDWVAAFGDKLNLSCDGALQKLKEHYDGYCFDGKHHVYNPWSVLNALSSGNIKNYWHGTATSSMAVHCLKRFGIDDPRTYDNISVDWDFTNTREIERAAPESFLYQTGYLTIKQCNDDSLILGYPNREVHQSLAKSYLEDVYCSQNLSSVHRELIAAISTGDIDKLVKLYNKAIAQTPYDIINRSKVEEYSIGGKLNIPEATWQMAMLWLLWGAGISVKGELHGKKGRTDFVAELNKRVYVIEFKVVDEDDKVENTLEAVMNQIIERKYAEQYLQSGKTVTIVGIVVNRVEKEASYRFEIVQG